jgi:glycosyltransferase involved in cell wall biosynthesis
VLPQPRANNEPDPARLAVSLVVPLRDEQESLEKLLASINCQTRPPDEVVLVDGGSTDGTVALARELTASDPRYRVIEAGAATPGRGRNVGIAAARCAWVALTDAGIRLEPTWLERLTEAVARAPEPEVIYGNYEPVVASRFERAAALAYVPPKRPRPGGPMRGPSTASMLLRKEVWETVGGFPDLRAAEDLVFFEQVRFRGFRVGWAPAATAWWQLRPTLWQTFRKFVLYSKHNVWAGRQRYWHYGVARLYLLAVPFVILAAVFSPWWLLVPAAGAAARVAKSIWSRREGRGLAFLLDPLQFLAVGVILAAIDAATFVGWAQALFWRPPRLNFTGVKFSDAGRR